MTDAERETCLAAIALHLSSIELHAWRARARIAPQDAENTPAVYCEYVAEEQELMASIVQAERRLHLAAARVIVERRDG